MRRINSIALRYKFCLSNFVSNVSHINTSLLFLIYIFLPIVWIYDKLNFTLKLISENQWFYEAVKITSRFCFSRINLEGVEKRFIRSNFILCTPYRILGYSDDEIKEEGTEWT